MKRLAIAAAALATMFAAGSANAGMTPVVGSASDVQQAGIICGPGMHLAGLVCVPNRRCPPGWHVGAGGACRRN